MQTLYPKMPAKTAGRMLQLLPRNKVRNQFLAALFIMVLSVVLPGKVFAQLPTISYSTPQTYQQGITISPLAPTSTNVGVLSFNSAPTVVGSGFGALGGIVTDAAGNIFVSDYGQQSVKKIAAGTNTPVAIATGLSLPIGVAVDAAGNVYVAEDGGTDVKKIPVGGGALVTVGSGFSSPYGVTVDAAGDVFVGDYGNHAVKEVLPSGAILTLGAGSFSGPMGVKLDRQGNLYVADYTAGAIKMIPAGNGTVVTVASGLTGPSDLALDLAGNIYVVESNRNRVRLLPADGGLPVFIGSGFNAPFGIAVDPAGNLLIADQLNDAVKKIKPTGGYFISKLPAGLDFSSSTGIISGTPSVTAPAASYRVTGYNPAGAALATISIGITLPPLPTISYSSPQTYQQGITISPLAPVSANIGVLSFNSTPTVVGSGFGALGGIVTDAAGNIFVSDYGHQSVKKIAAGTNTPVAIATGLSLPIGVAVDAAGNVYVAEDGSTDVKKIPVGGGALVTIGSGFSSPYGVTVDAAGNVFVGDYGNHAVKEVLASGAILTLGAGSFSGPMGVKLDRQGNLYVADYTAGAIKMIPAGNGTVVTVMSGLTGPSDLALDLAGNIYVVESNANRVRLLPAGGGPSALIGSGFNAPFGIAVDPAGNLLIADQLNDAVKKIKPTGGYFISKLPAGLDFSSSTGVISGTPSATAPAASYRVTGYNPAGAALATISIGITLPPLPTISYSSPQTYQQGITISPLAPVSANIGVLSFNSTPTVVGSGFGALGGIVTDAAGNIFVSDYGHQSVKKIAAGTNTPVAIATGLSLPIGVAADAAGNVYVAEDGSTDVKKIPVGGAALVTIGSGFSSPYGVTVDAAGNVFVGDYGNHAVKEVLASGAILTLGAGSFSGPMGVKLDRQGNLYVADYTAGAIKMIPAGNGTVVTVMSGLTGPSDLALDLAGNIYVVESNANRVRLLPAGGGPSALIGSGFNAPFGIAVDPAGNLLIADQLNDAVKKIKPTGGYFISKLPAGLSFSSSTGVISGTPSVQSPATDYTVTAYNPAGGAQAVANITITGPASLTNLAISSGTLSPSFVTGTISYTATVPFSTTQLTVTPTKLAPAATITINGTAVVSGHASGNIPLLQGPNTITTVVAAPDGITTQTYIITITRTPGSSNALLTKITTNSGIALTQVSGPDYKDYTISVSNAVSSITITPTTQDANATVKVNGVTVASETASASIPLQVGNTVINTVVTAQDGITTKTYGITVTRAAMMALYVPKDSTTADGLTIHQGVTPNGDGINDIFNIDGISAYPDNKVTIMSRSGAVIFEATGYDNQSKFFDGHSSKTGAMQLPGTYFYSLKYIANGKTEFKTGFIVLKY